MKIPITGYGRREVATIWVLAISAVLVFWWLWPGGRPWLELGILVLAGALTAFFRDPKRTIPQDWGILVAPADGKVTDIKQLAETEYLKGAATRIGIFLSVLDVHINRVPCAGEVEYIQRHPGKCINALRYEKASAENEALCLGLKCGEHPVGAVMVKQITGAIARRIVCDEPIGAKLEAGQKYGMIKFGSRTELYLPANEGAKIQVKVGDTVRAGTTVLVRYERDSAEGK
ncbi:MAG: phosphatidylserine decarboxylase family protein [Sedimentisphaerales bacterium]|nr:phosphatidylserine decarboxylase family protein [Sedimentisphaerales bacterium]